MTTSNNSSNNGSNCGSNYGNSTGSNWSSESSSTSKNWNSTGTGTATCTEYTTGTTLSVNEINSPGCYVCNWNGSLIRVGESCFTSAGFTAFNFTCTEPLTVTYLTDDPTATVEECREWANGSNVYYNF